MNSSNVYMSVASTLNPAKPHEKNYFKSFERSDMVSYKTTVEKSRLDDVRKSDNTILITLK
jgi:hypothetical protein